MTWRVCSWTLVSIFVGCGGVRAQDASSHFNGLDMNLGNLSRLSSAQSRSISPENFQGEKGKGGMATEGTGKGAAARSGPHLEGFALGANQGAQHVHRRGH